MDLFKYYFKDFLTIFILIFFVFSLGVVNATDISSDSSYLEGNTISDSVIVNNDYLNQIDQVSLDDLNSDIGYVNDKNYSNNDIDFEKIIMIMKI